MPESLYTPGSSAKTNNDAFAIIFFGGLGDSLTQKVVAFSKETARLHPRVTTRYWTWRQWRSAIRWIQELPGGSPLALVGHSFGGDAAGRVALALPGRVNLLITVDPVSVFRPGIRRLGRSVAAWVNVGRIAPTRTARLAEKMGGSWQLQPRRHGSLFIASCLPHNDFAGLMWEKAEGSFSAMDALNEFAGRAGSR
jgi:pimeloyl-ACP methyl ester carboxylesterase